HSMGGLLSRRYLLKYPDHHVAKLITIGSPWLGAPKSLKGLETGDVLDLQAWWAPVVNAVFKAILAEFPSAAQLVPSRGAFALGQRPLAEEGWDMNGNDLPVETYDRYADLVEMLDGRYANAPGTANRRFHDTPGQDDWRSVDLGVQFYHVVGIQSRERTIGAMRAVEKTACTRLFGVSFCRVTYRKFEPDLTIGDGTVPLLNAERIGAGLNLNDPNATIWEVDEQAGDGSADHSEMTANARVHACILVALQARGACALHEAPNAATAPNAPAQTRPPPLPTTYLDATGVQGVTVADALGNTTDTTSGTFSAVVPDVTFERMGDAAYLFMLPTDGTYTVTLHTGADPFLLDIRQGTSSATIRAVRYLDLALPANVEAIVRLTPQGIEQLRYDSDGDGTFDKTVTPTIVTGNDDVDPPIVTASVNGPLEARTLAVNVSDGGAGVRGVYYSLDGETFQPYTAPLTIDGLQTPNVLLFADDNVANRSSVLDVVIAHRQVLPIVQR
ncbi:MAG TPA: hypothetical protein VFX76_10815, partial [Roseiflexaceae bacterium]|nr:hypothetical protein [Roseiflexaceae bacterium]